MPDDQANPQDAIGALLKAARAGVKQLVERTLNDASQDATAFSEAIANAVVVAAATGKPEIVSEVANQGRLLIAIHEIRIQREARDQLLGFVRTAAEIALSAVLMSVRGPLP